MADIDEHHRQIEAATPCDLRSDEEIEPRGVDLVVVGENLDIHTAADTGRSGYCPRKAVEPCSG